ncbi:hypothetical protein BKA62DRAFT_716253 [Auriculariales sp. MPI-PUGE-AT-0066]|nr:hypothetical protein BKA62DRAFT_716253 [Auriculariales sp. MPI-PUGE-AT-0066]
MPSALPEDVLLPIFKCATIFPSLDWPEAKYDAWRATTPFTLAAVCKSWRILARSSASLWTYFGVPFRLRQHANQKSVFHTRHISRLHAAHKTRLQLLLVLSQGSPVDVVFFRDSDEVSTTGNTTELIGLLADLAPRWRHVRLVVNQSDLTSFAPALGGRCQRLRSLALNVNSERLIARPFSSAPELEALSLVYAGIERPEETPLDTSLPGLKTLRICMDSMMGTYHFCRTLATQLTELCIIDRAPWEAPRVTFGSLHRLTVVDATYLRHIHAPALHTLAFHVESLLRAPGPVADLSSYSVVRHLKLFGYVGLDEVEILQIFAEITALEFSVPRGVDNQSYGIDNTFFAALAGDTLRQTLWPKLERVIFDRHGWQVDSFDRYSVEDLIRRRAANSDGRAHTLPDLVDRTVANELEASQTDVQRSSPVIPDERSQDTKTPVGRWWTNRKTRRQRG